MIEFQDTGEGMSAETRTRALGSSLLNTTKKQGTGLGLAIVRRVLEAHHGKLRIKSQLGSGTVISLILPVEAERTEPA